MTTYKQFLETKAQFSEDSGFDPVYMPDFLFDFQQSLVEWATRKGRAAIFADCGMGKTPMALVWAENIVHKTGGRVLILTPLAVSMQFIRESEKFGIEISRSSDGGIKTPITVTNYERLHQFKPSDFQGVVCDESSILKNFDGKRKSEVTEFVRTLPYRLLCTATAAPNDYIELGTSSEALGELGHIDMLGRFFKNDQNTIKPTMYLHRGQDFGRIYDRNKWRFKHHAELPFWRWVCSWARAVRSPSDLGYDDAKFVLPELIERDHIVSAKKLKPGHLFPLPAVGLKDQREERRRTIQERCERVAELVQVHDRSIVWCHLNDEGDLLESILPDNVQVSGSDSDDEKERKLLAFVNGEVRILITKPKVAGFGLNMQHCAHLTFFPSHSYEQYYQSVRRCWRYGQERSVTVDIVSTEGEKEVMRNLKRKAESADRMFSNLVEFMNDARSVVRSNPYTKKMEVPEWLPVTR